MKSLSDEITNTLIESGTVSENQRKLYHYCVSGVIEIGANLIATLTIGLLMGKFIETLLFLLIIIPLRSTVGGYHADSSRVCFVMSILMYTATILTASTLSVFMHPAHSIWIYAFSAILILVLSPVDSKNRRLCSVDKKKLRKRCFLLIWLFSIIFSVLFMFEINTLCYIIACCMAVVFLSLCAGKIKNYRSGV
jgi:accessory gene regulator B